MEAAATGAIWGFAFGIVVTCGIFLFQGSPDSWSSQQVSNLSRSAWCAVYLFSDFLWGLTEADPDDKSIYRVCVLLVTNGFCFGGLGGVIAHYIWRRKVERNRQEPAAIVAGRPTRIGIYAKAIGRQVLWGCYIGMPINIGIATVLLLRDSSESLSWYWWVFMRPTMTVYESIGMEWPHFTGPSVSIVILSCIINGCLCGLLAGVITLTTLSLKPNK